MFLLMLQYDIISPDYIVICSAEGLSSYVLVALLPSMVFILKSKMAKKRVLSPSV